MEYSYWLGYIYQYECLMHEESSRMVYGTFSEKTMRRIYRKVKKTELMKRDLPEVAGMICESMDRLLV